MKINYVIFFTCRSASTEVNWLVCNFMAEEGKLFTCWQKFGSSDICSWPRILSRSIAVCRKCIRSALRYTSWRPSVRCASGRCKIYIAERNINDIFRKLTRSAQLRHKVIPSEAVLILKFEGKDIQPPPPRKMRFTRYFFDHMQDLSGSS